MRTRPTNCGTRRSAWRVAAALSFAVASAGCRDAAGPTARSAVGTWVLASVNGAALPFFIAGSRSYTDVMVADTLVLAAGGTAAAAAYVQDSDGGPPYVQRSVGTWTQVGDTVRLAWPRLPGQNDTTRAVQQAAVRTAPDQLASPWGLGYVDTDPYGTGVVYEDPREEWVRAR